MNRPGMSGDSNVPRVARSQKVHLARQLSDDLGPQILVVIDRRDRISEPAPLLLLELALQICNSRFEPADARVLMLEFGLEIL